MKYEFNCENCGKHMRVHRDNKTHKPPRFCSFACRVEGKRNDPPPFEREWLHQKYIVEGLGCPEIGRLVDRDGSTIQYWLEKYDIPRRPRGSDVRQQFKKGVATTLGRKASEETRRKIGEASRRRGQVPYLKDGKHHLAGERGRGELNPSWKGGITPERQAFYNSDEWKKAAKAVWVRDNAKCRRCGLDAQKVKRRKGDFHVHHIVTFANKVLRASVHNLVLLCDDCHYFVHSNDNVNQEFMGNYWRWNVRNFLYSASM